MAGAMTIAEGDQRFKVDASLIFGGNTRINKYVLRTSYDRLGVWKAKYVKTNTSPFQELGQAVIKDAAIIDGEVWVFGVDATNSNDIVVAVNIAAKFYKVKPEDIIREIYVKNLNVENENEMEAQAKIKANRSLYSKTSTALQEAAKKLNVTGVMNLWVFSSNINPKIPQSDLHAALSDAGATSVSTDEKPHNFWSGSNDGIKSQRIKTNLHLATFNL